jgi:hypothetical protein
MTRAQRDDAAWMIRAVEPPKGAFRAGWGTLIGGIVSVGSYTGALWITAGPATALPLAGLGAGFILVMLILRVMRQRRLALILDHGQLYQRGIGAGARLIFARGEPGKMLQLTAIPDAGRPPVARWLLLDGAGLPVCGSECPSGTPRSLSSCVHNCSCPLRSNRIRSLSLTCCSATPRPL